MKSTGFPKNVAARWMAATTAIALAGAGRTVGIETLLAGRMGCQFVGSLIAQDVLADQKVVNGVKRLEIQLPRKAAMAAALHGQELLGHADMRMTRRVYAHLLNVTIANTVKSKLPSFGHERSNVRKLRP